jgi:serine/threonine-protein kinase
MEQTPSPHPSEPKPALKPDPYIGQTIGNLELVEQIGIGGFGSVYRATHQKLQTSFAVKILHLQLHAAPRALERFKREALAIAQLSHPNIVRVTDFGQIPDGPYYLIMDYLDGQNVEDLLRHNNKLDLFAVQHLMQQACAALGYIHRKGIVHRDLKPANIFLVREAGHQHPTVKVVDFGIASLEEDSSITHTGICKGTPLYMSPEQATGESKKADARTDLYSLGIVLYELLTGFPPFQGSVKSVMYKQVHEPPRPLKQVRPRLSWSRKLEAVLQKVLAKEPDARYPDADSFLEAFEEAVSAQLSHTPDGVLFPPDESANPSPFGSLTEEFGPAPNPYANQSPWLWMVLVAVVALFGGAFLWQFLAPALQPTPKPPTPVRAILLQDASPPQTPRPAPTTPPDKRTSPEARPADTISRVSVRIVCRPRATVWKGRRKLGRTPLLRTGLPGQTETLTLRASSRKTRTIKIAFPNKDATILYRLKRKPRHKKPTRRRGGPFAIDDPI